jgi:hypothetical protein
MSAASGNGHCPRHPGADRDWTSADYAYYMDCNRDARADGCDPDGAVLAAAVQGGRLTGIGIKAPKRARMEWLERLDSASTADPEPQA